MKRIAAVMNEHFVCIKVDREERPDVDQIYMDAVHAMGVQGGWPLNVFLTPEAKPFYGGTYFPPRNWVQLLNNIGEAYQGEHRAELDAVGEQFAATFCRTSDLQINIASADLAAAAVSDEEFKLLMYNLGGKFDRERGGMNRAPKFPMPSIWRFLLRAYMLSPAARPCWTKSCLPCAKWPGAASMTRSAAALPATRWMPSGWRRTSRKCSTIMASSLACTAKPQVTQEELFRKVVYETVEFVRRELTNPEGGFYSSLDADSEGEEGKFYVFTKDELRDILGDEEPLFSDYYNCTAAGNWEHGRNILHRRQSDEAFAAAHEIAPRRGAGAGGGLEAENNGGAGHTAFAPASTTKSSPAGMP